MTFLADTSKDHSGIVSAQRVRRRMMEIFLRASREGRALSLMVIGVDDLETAGQREGLHEHTLMEACRQLLDDQCTQEQGTLHAYWDEARILALIELPLASAELMARRMILGARTLQLPTEDRHVHLSLSIGLAENRDDIELYFETLVHVAEEGLAVARARGGECCVHTMLYRSLQDMEERGEQELSVRPKVARQKVAGAPTPAPQSQPAIVATPDAHVEAIQAETPPSLGHAFVPTAEIDADAEVRMRAEALAEKLTIDAVRKIRREYEARLVSLRREVSVSDNPSEEVERMRLRIKKLTLSLEATEKRLLQVAKMKDVDLGVSSIYREVQGLTGADEGYAVKKEMMQNIFEANLAIQKKAG